MVRERAVGVALALAAPLVAWGCGASAPRSPAAVRGGAPVATPASPLRARLERTCAPCHDGVAGRVQIGGAAALDRDTAIRSALAVSSGRMPRAPGRLEDAERLEMIDELCAVATPNARACTTALDPAQHTPLVRSPAELVRMMSLLAPASAAPPQAGPLRGTAEMLNKYVPETVTVMHEDTTYLVMAGLLARERCRAVAPSAFASLDACVASLLDPDRLHVPAPPSATDGGVR